MINVGVIGVGMIGQEHARRLTDVVPGARVSAVADADLDRSRAVAAALPSARVCGTGAALVADAEVDAVVVASAGSTHEEFVLAAITAGKPVLCEKPLADTAAACSRIVDAEVAAGRRLVQVGFMRRYDERYRALRAAVRGGRLGSPLLMHAAHRNASMPDFFTTEMLITDSAVHEVDIVRWLFDAEITAVTVLRPRPHRLSTTRLTDPLVLVLETAGGVLVDVEVLARAGFGYDIRGEVVCEDGTVALSDDAGVVVRSAGTVSGPVPTRWQERFASAFDAEFRDWVAAVAGGSPSGGPSAWDGYAASVVCDAGVAALRSGAREPVRLRERPPLYEASAPVSR